MAQLPVPYSLFQSFVSPTARFASPNWALYLTSTKVTLSNLILSPYLTMASIPLEQRILYRTVASPQKPFSIGSRSCSSLSNPLLSVAPSRDIALGTASSDSADHSNRALSSLSSYRGWGSSHSPLHSKRVGSSTVTVPQFGHCSSSLHHLISPDPFRSLGDGYSVPVARISQRKEGINSCFSARKLVSFVKSSRFPIAEVCSAVHHVQAGL